MAQKIQKKIPHKKKLQKADTSPLLLRALNAAQVGFFVLSITKKGDVSYVSTNEHYQRIYGLNKKIPIEKPTDHMDLPQAKKYMRHLQKCVQSGKPHTFESKITPQKMGPRWIQIHIELAASNKEKSTRIMGIIQDITEHKETTDKLQREVSKQKALSEISNIALEERTIDSFFNRVCKVLADTLDIDFTKVQKLSMDGATLETIAQLGWGKKEIKQQTKFTANTQSAYTISADEPVIVTDFASEERFGHAQKIDNLGIKSGMSVLIGGKAGPFGVLSVNSKRPRRFKIKHVEFFMAVADILANAIKHFQAEEAVMHSENLVSSILKAAEIGICVCDERERFIRTNDAFSQITGYPKNKLKGRAFTMLYPINQREEMRHEFQAFADGNFKRFEAEHEIQHMDGRRIPISVRGSRINLNNDEKSMIFTVTDITQTRRDERNLKLLRSIAVNTKDLILITDIRSEPPGPEILWVNQAFETVTGYTAKEVLGQTLMLLEGTETDPQTIQKLNQAIQQRREYSQDIKYQNKMGEDFWVNTTIVPMMDGETHKNWLIIMHNITKRKAAEEKILIAKKEADIASKAKSDYLAEMSHEIRTPLNSIIGFADFLKNQYLGNLGDPKYLEYARDIHTSGTYLLDLINNILDLSKIEAGEMQLHENTFNIISTLEKSVELLRHKIEEGGVKIDLKLPQNPLYFIGDETKIKQIIINLLSNAIKFTPSNGHVSLSVEPSDKTRDFKICVIDDGIGIEESNVERVFTPYQHSKNPLLSKNKGTGLGLPLSKALTELHGGTLRINSKMNEGTKIEVILPKDRLTEIVH